MVDVLDFEDGDDDVGRGDEDDEEDADVVDDAGRALPVHLVDVQRADDEEQHAHQHLTSYFFSLASS